jgi:hypothetical protein
VAFNIRAMGMVAFRFRWNSDEHKEEIAHLEKQKGEVITHFIHSGDKGLFFIIS